MIKNYIYMENLTGFKKHNKFNCCFTFIKCNQKLFAEPLRLKKKKRKVKSNTYC